MRGVRSVQELGRRLGVPNLPAMPMPGGGLASFPLPPPLFGGAARGPGSVGSSGRATEADEGEVQLPGDINVEEARCVFWNHPAIWAKKSPSALLTEIGVCHTESVSVRGAMLLGIP